jgi:hypothetical protein
MISVTRLWDDVIAGRALCTDAGSRRRRRRSERQESSRGEQTLRARKAADTFTFYTE